MTNLAPRLVEAPAPRKAVRKATKPVVKPADHLVAYANCGVVIMAVLSAILNGYANAENATVEWAGWGMGLVIPAIILVLGKVASLLWKRRQYRAAYITASVGVGLLALSVWHCSLSIAMLTGSPLLLAVPFAVAIDCGFVCCEWAALQE